MSTHAATPPYSITQPNPCAKAALATSTGIVAPWAVLGEYRKRKFLYAERFVCLVEVVEVDAVASENAEIDPTLTGRVIVLTPD
jgi:hypothetical protein